jgi:hypothetical protein
MTTSVEIKNKGGTHRVKVEVLKASDETVLRTAHLNKADESVELYVFNGQAIRISEANQ